MNVWAIVYGFSSFCGALAAGLLFAGIWRPDAETVAFTALVAFQLANLGLYFIHSRNLVRAH